MPARVRKAKLAHTDPLPSEVRSARAPGPPFPGSEDVASMLGVGQKLAQVMAKVGISNREDLLYHLPKRYENRSQFAPLSSAKEGDEITYRGVVREAKNRRISGGRGMLDITLAPARMEVGTSETLLCRWFGAHFLAKLLVPGVEVVVHGTLASRSGRWQMVQPEHEIVVVGEEEQVHLNRLTPIYGLTEGLRQKHLRRILYDATLRETFTWPEFYPAPPALIPLRQAFPAIHFPKDEAERAAAYHRLVYDEFFCQQCVLARQRLFRKRAEKKRPASALTPRALGDSVATGANGKLLPEMPDPALELAHAFLAALPFQPTGAQTRVMREIESDLRRPVVMNRLLQGDVGAGKTMVAVYALLIAVGRGQRGAIMAPTETLAEQHYLTLSRWLRPLGIKIGLHTGTKRHGVDTSMDELPFDDAPRAGAGAIVVGTHALLYDAFTVDDLDLIVIDEQHKFGVMQRLALAKKGSDPDMLVMTATPIPRTLQLTLYGDLDTSVLDELPPGRQRIVTARRAAADMPKVWTFMRAQLDAGRQAFVVCPLVDESDAVAAKAVTAEFVRIRDELLPGVRVGLLHGRLPTKDKEAVMSQFRAGQIQVLVATPVIEVGVDVPSATMMVILSAERFGLAQLHQLRGRIGRGAEKSYCVLAGEATSAESWRRLAIMEQTGDGFRIAEEDLRIRGPGNIFGTEQSGELALRVGDPVAQLEWLQAARRQADEMVHEDPTLERWPLLKARLERLSLQGHGLAGY